MELVLLRGISGSESRRSSEFSGSELSAEGFKFFGATDGREASGVEALRLLNDRSLNSKRIALDEEDDGVGLEVCVAGGCVDEDEVDDC